MRGEGSEEELEEEEEEELLVSWASRCTRGGRQPPDTTALQRERSSEEVQAVRSASSLRVGDRAGALR